MDVHMPEMDGFEATGTIRKAQDGTCHTPVIAMTARAMAGDREKCIEAGMDDHVSKPVRREELIGAVERWLRPKAERFYKGRKRALKWRRNGGCDSISKPRIRCLQAFTSRIASTT